VKTVALITLVAIGGIVVIKHIKGAGVHLDVSLEATGAPSGVPVYSDTAAPQRSMQVYAAKKSNPWAVSSPGYAPAFGADENQPQSGALAY
jgi:hypothetical protein